MIVLKDYGIFLPNKDRLFYTNLIDKFLQNMIYLFGCHVINLLTPLKFGISNLIHRKKIYGSLTKNKILFGNLTKKKRNLNILQSQKLTYLLVLSILFQLILIITAIFSLQELDHTHYGREI